MIVYTIDPETGVRSYPYFIPEALMLNKRQIAKKLFDDISITVWANQEDYPWVTEEVWAVLVKEGTPPEFVLEWLELRLGDADFEWYADTLYEAHQAHADEDAASDLVIDKVEVKFEYVIADLLRHIGFNTENCL
jgi:hypothetical protein